ncbi:sarcosine oxidase subunit gamma [Aliiruegeria sabulilitoris]|uniref:sarcosine oxidase subunit gamma n=1 Tax=Aliiruegeria sabulilitoris TaxID=1510458 RepID=UPI000829C839|nr:sarcosine oxidase subunit gamma family protein [Aliiruegeria sabulilitoris]NDR55288.1 sarcosine oxidase subunit gamma [Pseudoruegeria sp. M32A2M]
MSDAVTALNGASSVGPVAQVEERGLQGMVTLRADLSDPALAGAVEAATGCALPESRQILTNGDRAVAWMSPDELLLLVPYADTAAVVAALEAALSGVHHLAVDVSDARASFSISGPGAREVLARLCPADLSPAGFGPGEIRRTWLAQVPAAFWTDEAGRFTLVCFRSVARYAFDALAGAARGDKVGFFSQG